MVASISSIPSSDSTCVHTINVNFPDTLKCDPVAAASWTGFEVMSNLVQFQVLVKESTRNSATVEITAFGQAGLKSIQGYVLISCHGMLLLIVYDL